jgi:hypothetical protein
LFDGFGGAAGGDHGAEAALLGAGFVLVAPGFLLDESEEVVGGGGFGGVFGLEEKVGEAAADGAGGGAWEGEPGFLAFPIDLDLKEAGGRGGAEPGFALGIGFELETTAPDGFDTVARFIVNEFRIVVCVKFRSSAINETASARTDVSDRLIARDLTFGSIPRNSASMIFDRSSEAVSSCI